jgi:hypothetical protein
MATARIPLQHTPARPCIESACRQVNAVGRQANHHAVLRSYTMVAYETRKLSNIFQRMRLQPLFNSGGSYPQMLAFSWSGICEGQVNTGLRHVATKFTTSKNLLRNALLEMDQQPTVVICMYKYSCDQLTRLCILGLRSIGVWLYTP